MRTFAPSAVFAAVISFATGVPVTADAGVPVPGIRRVLVTHRITARESFSDHVFVLCDGDEARRAEFVTVEPGHPLLIEFFDANAPPPVGRAFGWWATLLIVPRADAPPGSAVEVAAAVFAGRIPAATRRMFFRRDEAPAWAGTRIAIDYEVRRIDGDRLEAVRTTPDQMNLCCAATVLCPLAALLGGCYFIRLWRRQTTRTT